MPREVRKRGKKKSKAAQEEEQAPVQQQLQPVEPVVDEAPSWIEPSNAAEVDPEAPFGYVDADVKAYFRSVDLKIREWQGGEADAATEGHDLPQDVDSNEERRGFIMAALQEMSQKELQLCTDPDCAGILERIAPSMDDFVKRVFMDTLTGSYEQLASHRFGSHVVQTHLTLARGTVAREIKGIIANRGDSESAQSLRTMTQLILDLCDEILPIFIRLLMNPFGSHVVRALLLLLSPSLTSSSSDPSSTSLRSKKSQAYKAKQGPMKSILIEGSEGDVDASSVPKEFEEAAKTIVRRVRDEMGENEVRAIASDKVASPVLQMLLRVEASANESNVPGSLMDRVLMGMITELQSNPDTLPTRSDYLETLLRDTTSSHLVEVLVLSSPESVFDAIWKTYFVGRMSKMVNHPVANFVVAKGASRLDKQGLEAVLEEIGTGWDKSIKTAKTGLLKAMIDRVAVLGVLEEEMVNTTLVAFGLSDPSTRIKLVPCALRLQHLESLVEADSAPPADPSSENTNSQHHPRRRPAGNDRAVTFSVQGALLLQSLLRLREPSYEVVTDSLFALPIDELLRIACDPTGSRVLDVVLTLPPASVTGSSTSAASAASPSLTDLPIYISPRVRRKLILSFVESKTFHKLMDDKLGSRVADRCWAVADVYLRERIARSLIPHQAFLAGSFYGKFLARTLHLTLLQRNTEAWKKMQVEAKKGLTAPSSFTPVAKENDGKAENRERAEKDGKKKKRKRGDADAEDDIDDIFAGGGGKTKTKGAKAEKSKTEPKVVVETADEKDGLSGGEVDGVLADVLGAIKEVPKGMALKEGGSRKKKKVRT